MTNTDREREPDPVRRLSDSTLPAGPPTARPRTRSEALPRTVGRYSVLRRLGAGGMGEVFLAYDPLLGRKVALKRVRLDREAEADVRRRFQLEARVTAFLQHPAIIPIYHYEPEERGTYYTMRPVEGFTLGELLARLRTHQSARDEWPTARLVRLFLQAANAVAYAHSRGVIHRDLKPANIMIGPFEEVLILDWGMARVVELPEGVAADTLDRPASSSSLLLEPSPPTLVGLAGDESGKYAFVGTPGYMAPEQFDGVANATTEVFSLGIMLFELLTLRPPWAATTVNDLRLAMRSAPRAPHSIRPGHGIPSPLSDVVLKALAFDPGARYSGVTPFSRDVAHAVEGRASWQLRAEARDASQWRIADGKVYEQGGDLVLNARGSEQPFRYFCLQAFGDDLRVEFELMLGRGTNELSIWLNTSLGQHGRIEEGYDLTVVPGRRRLLSLLRSGRDVAGARSPEFEPRVWYRVVARRQHDRISLTLDGDEIYAYSDPIPLSRGNVGFTGRGPGVRLRGLRIYSLGTDTMVSCLAVPDAFYNRRLFDEARSEYERIAASHPGRREGRLARFRAGLCALDLAREELEPELRAVLLEDAKESFVDQHRTNESCLTALGRAMVAGEQGHAAEKRDALAQALEQFEDDPYLRTVHEWLLGRLHALDPDQRTWVARLVPLAIDHCMSTWGRRVVRELVNQVRSEWETPSFLTGRGRFRENDPVSHAEAKLYFDFWVGRGDGIEATARALASTTALRPHHLADVVLALAELGDRERAAISLRHFSAALHSQGPDQRARFERVEQLCSVVLVALDGSPEAGLQLIASAEPGVPDRIFNSARLWVARACHDLGLDRELFDVLRPLTPGDTFAREHTAWFALARGEEARVIRSLQPLLERGDHRTDKNMANFLFGALLIAQGKKREAARTFQLLSWKKWPRTWTLGSLYASGQLGGTQGIESYLGEVFPWERSQLESQVTLLKRVGFEPS
ncbi:MAG: protein kinase [Planctomycetota bacterium]